jgi:hypothetical protein
MVIIAVILPGIVLWWIERGPGWALSERDEHWLLAE